MVLQTRSSEDKDPEIAIIDKEPGASDSARKKSRKRKQECLEDKELVQNILRDNKVVRNARQQHELDELQANPQIALPWTPEGKGSSDSKAGLLLTQVLRNERIG